MELTGLWTEIRADEMHAFEPRDGRKLEIFATRRSGPTAPMAFTVNRDPGWGEGAL